jgi:DNA mismatch repair protein MSH6
MLKERNDSAGKGKREKVVARELCSVLSSGTRTYCHLDDLSLLEDSISSSNNNSSSSSSSVLMCIKEVLNSEVNNTTTTPTDILSEYGICCVDSVLGTITIAQFQDNKQRSRLRTMLARYRPSEILLEKGHCSAFTTGDYVDDYGDDSCCDRTVTILYDMI